MTPSNRASIHFSVVHGPIYSAGSLVNDFISYSEFASWLAHTYRYLNLKSIKVYSNLFYIELPKCSKKDYPYIMGLIIDL